MPCIVGAKKNPYDSPVETSSCADFEDIESGDTLDLDIDVSYAEGTLEVADVRIHKLSGVARYTYDEDDNRIPLGKTKSHLSKEKSDKDKEHGGKEHGGD